MIRGFRFFALALVLPLLAGCSGDGKGGGGVGSPTMGTLRVRLTDAPADYDAINLVIEAISIRRAGDESDEGWESLPIDGPVTVDLLTLRNGVFSTLTQGQVPSGPYNELRLILGEGSTIVVDGVTHPLKVPSGMSSGYKLKGFFNVPAGGLTDLTIDWDAARAVRLTGNDRYMLHPVARIVVTAVAGAIAGRLLPEDAVATIRAISGDDTLQTTVPGEDRRFVLGSLQAGSYSVSIDADAPYRDTTLTDVSVTLGQVTELGDVTLEQE